MVITLRLVMVLIEMLYDLTKVLYISNKKMTKGMMEYLNNFVIRYWLRFLKYYKSIRRNIHCVAVFNNFLLKGIALINLLFHKY